MGCFTKSFSSSSEQTETFLETACDGAIGKQGTFLINGVYNFITSKKKKAVAATAFFLILGKLPFHNIIK